MLSPQPSNEAERLAVLHSLAILNTPPSPGIDRICRIAEQVFEVSMVHVTLVDAHRLWFKGRRGGSSACEVAREHAFCNYTIMHDEVFVVSDALADRTFTKNQYVVGPPYIRFYAGSMQVPR